jgi:hypothetical protein
MADNGRGKPAVSKTRKVTSGYRDKIDARSKKDIDDNVKAPGRKKVTKK